MFKEIAPILLVLLLGNCSAAVLAGTESGSPLSTAGVSPYFDWGEGQGRRSQQRQCETKLLRGGVQVQCAPVGADRGPAAVVPGDSGRTDAGSAGASGSYIGTPPLVTLHSAIMPVAQIGSGDLAVDSLFAMTLPGSQKDGEGSKAAHFRVNFRKVVYKGKNILNSVFDYRAFGPSTEAADLLLGGQRKFKSSEADGYYKQRELDSRHVQNVANIMQLSMGLGFSGTVRGEALISKSLASLRDLVGERRAEEILATLKQAAKVSRFARTATKQDIWDMKEQEDKIAQIVQSACGIDPVVQEMRRELSRYSRHSKFTVHATGIVRAALNIAAFSPTFLAPAAETANFALVLATGGPEQDKLLREVYLSKRLESRLKVLDEKAHMAVDTYHKALILENPVLLTCSEAMVRQMSGEDSVREVFGDVVVSRNVQVYPPEAVESAGTGAPLRSAAVESRAPAGDAATPTLSEIVRRMKCEPNPGM